jgi:hypothetical protein
MLAYLLEQEPSQSIIGDMFHQLQEEIGKLTFFGQLWGFLKMFLRRYFDIVNQFFYLKPQFRDCIDPISYAFNASNPLQGCEV